MSPGGPMDWALVAAALVFAVAAGVNDGATLLSLGSRIPSLPATWALGILAAAVSLAPLALGVAVARTFLDRLVGFGEGVGAGVLSAVAAALLVVVILGWRGIPTSLTVATLGGLVGSGMGSGLPVNWGTLLVVAAVALSAPGLAAAVSFALMGAAARVATRSRAVSLRRAHVVAFVFLCLAYGANDGQKMYAVYAAVGGAGVSAALGIGELLLLTAFFMAGAVIAMRRYGRTLGLAVLPVRPLNAVTAELSAAAVATGTGLVGSPVSSVQSLVASLVGSGIREGYRRVRWRTVFGIGVAWITTFPMAFGLGALFGWAAERIG